MLWNCCHALVEEKLQAVMVCLHNECPAPHAGTPMAYDLDQTDELSFIGHQVGVVGGYLATEESDQPAALMKHRTDAEVGCIALDHECMVKIQEL
jgi:hypothetical protein